MQTVIYVCLYLADRYSQCLRPQFFDLKPADIDLDFLQIRFSSWKKNYRLNSDLKKLLRVYTSANVREEFTSKRPACNRERKVCDFSLLLKTNQKPYCIYLFTYLFLILDAGISSISCILLHGTINFSFHHQGSEKQNPDTSKGAALKFLEFHGS